MPIPVPSRKELLTKNAQELYQIMDSYRDATPAEAAALDELLDILFTHKKTLSKDREWYVKATEFSDFLAEKFGLPTAVKHYEGHMQFTKDWVGGENTGELKYSFAYPDKTLIHKNLRHKIVNDIATYAAGGVDPKDIMDINPAGELVGIKITKDETITSVISWLKNNTPPDLSKYDKMTPEERKEALSWWTNETKKNFVTIPWETLQKLVDSGLNSVFKQKTLEDMGSEMCLQLLLFPFKFLENYTAKWDDWAKKKAKERYAEMERMAAEFENVKDPSNPDDKPDDSDDLPPEEDEKKQVALMNEFRKNYVELVEEEANSISDPALKTARLDFAKDLKDAWERNPPYTPDELKAAHPDLEKKLLKDMDHTLAENYVVWFKKKIADRTDFDKKTALTVRDFLECKLFPKEWKDEITFRIEELGGKVPESLYKVEEKDKKLAFRRNATELKKAEEILNLLTPIRDLEKINGTRFRQTTNHTSPTSADPHDFGIVTDSVNKTLTRYSKNEDGTMALVTYFVDSGKAIVMQTKQQTDGTIILDKDATKIVEGFKDPKSPVVKVNGIPLSDTKLDAAWKRRYKHNTDDSDPTKPSVYSRLKNKETFEDVNKEPDPTKKKSRFASLSNLLKDLKSDDNGEWRMIDQFLNSTR